MAKETRTVQEVTECIQKIKEKMKEHKKGSIMHDQYDQEIRRLNNELKRAKKLEANPQPSTITCTCQWTGLEFQSDSRKKTHPRFISATSEWPADLRRDYAAAIKKAGSFDAPAAQAEYEACRQAIRDRAAREEQREKDRTTARQERKNNANIRHNLALYGFYLINVGIRDEEDADFGPPGSIPTGDVWRYRGPDGGIYTEAEALQYVENKRK